MVNFIQNLRRSSTARSTNSTSTSHATSLRAARNGSVSSSSVSPSSSSSISTSPTTDTAASTVESPLTTTPRSSIAPTLGEEQQQLIIGLDYGTSYSGAAFAICNTHSTLASLQVIDIKSIGSWPSRLCGRLALTSDKVPSTIAFSTARTYYGFEIPRGSDTPLGLERLEWLKLLLEPHPKRDTLRNADEVQRMRAALERLGKSPVDAASQYLGWLWNHVRQNIRDVSGIKDIFSKAEVRVVMTVPAVWSDKARENTLLAVERAGIVGKGVALKFTTEPEAAAILAIKNKVLTGQIKNGECFIVVDAGGGTVDVVTYQVRSTEPLKLDEVVAADGDLCGSVFIDLEFRKQLMTFMGDLWHRLSAKALRNIGQTWEYEIKRSYNPARGPGDPNADEIFEIDLPGVADNEELGIRDGVLQVQEQILRHSFDTIVHQVLDLIDNQTAGLRKRNLAPNLKAILLVGGFGGSSFLKSRIEQEYPSDPYTPTIEIWQPELNGCWTSVATGAVRCELLGLGHVSPVNTRLSRLNYGSVYKESFNPTKHRPEDRRTCAYTGKEMAVDQIRWFVRKGDEIHSNNNNNNNNNNDDDGLVIVEDFSFIIDEPRSPLRWGGSRSSSEGIETIESSVGLVRSDQDAAPNHRNEHVKNFVDIVCRFPVSILEGKIAKKSERTDTRFWRIPVQVEVKLGAVMLSFRCLAAGSEVGKTSANYRDVLD